MSIGSYQITMHVFRTLPKSVMVAVSGGVDSMVLLHFLKNKGHDVSVVHHMHNDKFAYEELVFVEGISANLGIPMYTGTTPIHVPHTESAWRNERYRFFKSFDGVICTGHTWNDLVEWYLFTALRGEGRLMEYAHANVVRPFIGTKKDEILEYAYKHGIKWIEDPSNADVDFADRNRIRHEILPAALRVNPGLFRTIKNKFEEKMVREQNKLLTAT